MKLKLDNRLKRLLRDPNLDNEQGRQISQHLLTLNVQSPRLGRFNYRSFAACKSDLVLIKRYMDSDGN